MRPSAAASALEPFPIKYTVCICSAETELLPVLKEHSKLRKGDFNVHPS